MSYCALHSKKGLAGPSGIYEAKVSWQRSSVSPSNELTLISLLHSMCLSANSGMDFRVQQPRPMVNYASWSWKSKRQLSWVHRTLISAFTAPILYLAAADFTIRTSPDGALSLLRGRTEENRD